MPLNAGDITRQIKEVGQEAVKEAVQKRKQLEAAIKVLHQACAIQEIIQASLSKDNQSNARFTIPLKEQIDQTFPLPANIIPVIRIGTDGSQISPDKNSVLDYAVVNCGALKIAQNGISQQYSETKLLTGKRLLWQGERIDTDYLELIRDVEERAFALNIVESNTSQPTLVLFDGVLEIYQQGRQTAGKIDLFDQYLATLNRYYTENIILTGYVDFPKSRLVLNMLELSLPFFNLGNETTDLVFPDINDGDLFAELLNAGQRSAVFRVNSPVSRNYPGQLAVHVFYINASPNNSPRIARVELPRYVYESVRLLNILHATIIDDSKSTGGFPYILHRAHEIARLTSADKEIIETRLGIELLSRGLKARKKSPKQALKDL